MSADTVDPRDVAIAKAEAGKIAAWLRARREIFCADDCRCELLALADSIEHGMYRLNPAPGIAPDALAPEVGR